MIKGTPRFDGLAIGELSISYLSNLTARKEGGPPVIAVKAGFVNSETGATHGWTKGGGPHGAPKWSATVYEKAEELRELLELELAQLHFENVEEGPAPSRNADDPDEGIGEHAEGGDYLSELPPG